MIVEDDGTLYLADQRKKVQILRLGADDAITVNNEDILVFEDSVKFVVETMDSLAGVFAGEFTNVTLSGSGCVAITTHGDPLMIEPPVSTDSSATVARNGVSPNVETDKTSQI